MPIAASKVGVDAHAVSARTAGKGWQSRGEDCIATTEDLESKHDARDQQSVANMTVFAACLSFVGQRLD